MTATLFRHGTIVNAHGRQNADVLVEDGVVTTVGKFGDSVPENAEVIDCRDRLLIPGGVDVHTHLDAPMFNTVTADNFYTGTVAAATGGTTTVVNFAQQLAEKTLLESTEVQHAQASGEAVIDYGFHQVVTDLYDGFGDHMVELADSGVSSFKVFMAYRGQLMIDDGQMYDILKRVGASGAKLCVHAENGDVIDRIANDLVEAGKTGPGVHEIARPPATEIEAVNRAIRISRMAEVPLYFVHLSTNGAVDAVGEAQISGWPIAAETCTHYLALSRDIYDAEGFEPAKAVLTPPLREDHHREALWQGIDSGVLSVVSSDHCPFCFSEKRRLGGDDFRTIPNGGPGVEDRMLMLFEQGVNQRRISLERYVEVTSASPARQFGLFPKKGLIAGGSDADIVIVNPGGSTTISAETQNQAMDYNLFEGSVVGASFERVYSRGALVAQDRKFVGKKGAGEFVSR